MGDVSRPKDEYQHWGQEANRVGLDKQLKTYVRTWVDNYVTAQLPKLCSRIATGREFESKTIQFLAIACRSTMRSYGAYRRLEFSFSRELFVVINTLAFDNYYMFRTFNFVFTQVSNPIVKPFLSRMSMLVPEWAIDYYNFKNKYFEF